MYILQVHMSARLDARTKKRLGTLRELEDVRSLDERLVDVSRDATYTISRNENERRSLLMSCVGTKYRVII